MTAEQMHPFDLDAIAQAGKSLREHLQRIDGRFSGQIEEVKGGFVVAKVPKAVVGHICCMRDPARGTVGHAEIIAIEGERALLAPFELSAGLSRRIEVVSTGRPAETRIRPAHLGCVVDWRGHVVSRFARSDVKGSDAVCPIRNRPPGTADRRPVEVAFDIGVRAINALCTVGEGQRIGIFGGAGTGKSSVIDIVLHGAKPDILVLALIGERGREVTELEQRLARSNNAVRTVVYAATSDRPAVERLNAVQAATRCAELWRDRGKRVLLIVDSITRIARAMREIGLARGEMPTRRGYPVSVFEQLPLIFERAGRLAHGSITALYTVLTEGEISEDPIAEETMSLIDGHILLSRSIAAKGVYPAIDVARSLSRSMAHIVSDEHRNAARQYRALAAAFDEVEVMLRMGEYRQGHDALADLAIERKVAMTDLVRQNPHDVASLEDSIAALEETCA